jgi:hypothetical protein
LAARVDSAAAQVGGWRGAGTRHRQGAQRGAHQACLVTFNQARQSQTGQIQEAGKKLQFDRNEAKRLHRQHPEWNAKMVARKITDATGKHPSSSWAYRHWN